MCFPKRRIIALYYILFESIQLLCEIFFYSCFLLFQLIKLHSKYMYSKYDRYIRYAKNIN